jgi:aspartate kinase
VHNRLLRCAREAEKRNSRGYDAVVSAIREDHHAAGKAVLKDSAILEQYYKDVDAECDSLIRILESAQHLEEVSIRAEDKIVAKGEKLSCRYMTAVLNDRGIDACYIDLSDVINFKVARTLDEDFYNELAGVLGKEILDCGDKVPVITGYFGTVPGGLLNCIGRGYTDLCAALVAIGVEATELQIWKEVDGIFTADPRKVPTARLIPSVTPNEAAELTFYGSEVIHPFTMEQVIRARIPIRIKNVMNARGSGTVIFPDPLPSPPPTGTVVSVTNSSPNSPGRTSPRPETPALIRSRSASIIGTLSANRPKRPTAVTIKHHIVVLNVHSNKRTRAHGFLMNIFNILDRWHLSVDLISSSEVHVSMALHSESALLSGGGEDEYEIADEELRQAVEELSHYGTVDIVPDMAIVSLVGKQLKNMVGISGRLFSVLGENNINIEMISQGECVVFLDSFPLPSLCTGVLGVLIEWKYRCKRNQHQLCY